jgi:pSer/pThr/pTyr-binding forkhead associated (FHA) protein
MKTQRGTAAEVQNLAYTLHIAGGEGDGAALQLVPGRDCILGRSRQADVHVEDDKASRRHCRLFFVGSALHIEDLDSANGTLVNGRRIRAAVTLGDGDSIRIGKATFHVRVRLPLGSEAQAWWEKSRTTVDAATGAADHTGRTGQWMSGALKSMPLVDLLQLLSTAQKSATLTLRNKDKEGRLFLRDGNIVQATLNGHSSPQPVKTVFRLLRWKAGRFELAPLGALPEGPEITGTTASLLLEGVQLADEIVELEDRLPADDAQVAFAKDAPVALRDLTPEDLDCLQLVLQHERWLDVIDHHPGTDLEAARALLALVERGVLTIR